MASLLVAITCAAAAAQQPAAPSATPPPAGAAAGIGDLLIAPPRLIFEGRQRSAELNLVNIGTRTETYRISLVQMRMDEKGDLKNIDNPGAPEALASSLIRYSPHQVTLEPRVSQVVRMQLRLPADLADGEYRVHMLFQGDPPKDAPPVTADAPPLKPNEFRVLITTVYGVSIPIFVRKGVTSAKVSISDLTFNEEAESPKVHFVIHRSGNRSVYGELVARFTPRGGSAQVVGLATGVAVYPEVDQRAQDLVLRLPDGVKLKDGKLRLTYRDAETGEGDILAEAEISLP